MLTGLDLSLKLDKNEYKNEMSDMQARLAHLQQKVMEAKLPVILVFEGWSASGKGTAISRVANALDPRYFDMRTAGTITEDKILRPFLWSFWTYLPPRGQIAIMDKSWHRIILPSVREEWKLSNREANSFHVDVNAFERQLTDDGYLILKFFLHISKDEQIKRFKKLEEDKNASWRLTRRDWEQNENYDQNIRHFEKLLRETSTGANPWNIIEAEDKRFASHKIMKITIDALEKQLEQCKPNKEETVSTIVTPMPGIPRRLNSISPNETIEDKEYRELLDFYQARLRRLCNRMHSRRRSAVVAFEGWDAAGKGGNIKRLTSNIDPRAYTVVPIGPPSSHELARHYLWRFMVKMPKRGHLTIFDRSWYGRVLIERVDKLTPPHIWQRAYQEINEMEQHLVGHGIILLKFWLHIDQEEQLRRFEARQNDPMKQHKITAADWQNRAQWDEYEIAIDEMLARTHTSSAPWIIVESNSKKYARIKVLKTLTDALEDSMG